MAKSTAKAPEDGKENSGGILSHLPISKADDDNQEATDNKKSQKDDSEGSGGGIMSLLPISKADDGGKDKEGSETEEDEGAVGDSGDGKSLLEKILPVSKAKEAKKEISEDLLGKDNDNDIDADIETGADTLLSFLEEKTKFPVSDISDDLGVPEKTVKTWAKALQKSGYVEITYSAIKGMVLEYAADESYEELNIGRSELPSDIDEIEIEVEEEEEVVEEKVDRKKTAHVEGERKSSSTREDNSRDAKTKEEKRKEKEFEEHKVEKVESNEEEKKEPAEDKEDKKSSEQEMKESENGEKSDSKKDILKEKTDGENKLEKNKNKEKEDKEIEDKNEDKDQEDDEENSSEEEDEDKEDDKDDSDLSKEEGKKKLKEELKKLNSGPDEEDEGKSGKKVKAKAKITKKKSEAKETEEKEEVIEEKDGEEEAKLKEEPEDKEEVKEKEKSLNEVSPNFDKHDDFEPDRIGGHKMRMEDLGRKLKNPKVENSPVISDLKNEMEGLKDFIVNHSLDNDQERQIEELMRELEKDLRNAEEPSGLIDSIESLPGKIISLVKHKDNSDGVNNERR